MSRAARSSRFARAHQAAEQDFLEGLPIRKWGRFVVPVTGPHALVHPDAGPDEVGSAGHDNFPADDEDDCPWPELPMPKDFHQLPDVSQQLLRIARSSRVARGVKRPAAVAGLPEGREDDRSDDDGDGEMVDVVRPEEDGVQDPAAATVPDQSVRVRRWVVVPRRLEEPEKVLLVKRRVVTVPEVRVKQADPTPVHSPVKAAKSTPVKAEATSKAPVPVVIPSPAPVTERPVRNSPLMTRTTFVRTLDPTGQPIIWRVLAPADRSIIIFGEIADPNQRPLETMTAADYDRLRALHTAASERKLAPGTMIGGVGLVNRDGKLVTDALVRRHRPHELGIAKRRGGPGRGKKKIIFRPVSSDQELLSGRPVESDGLIASVPTRSLDEPSQTEADPDEADPDDGAETDGTGSRSALVGFDGSRDVNVDDPMPFLKSGPETVSFGGNEGGDSVSVGRVYDPDLGEDGDVDTPMADVCVGPVGSGRPSPAVSVAHSAPMAPIWQLDRDVALEGSTDDGLAKAKQAAYLSAPASVHHSVAGTVQHSTAGSAQHSIAGSAQHSAAGSTQQSPVVVPAAIVTPPIQTVSDHESGNASDAPLSAQEPTDEAMPVVETVTVVSPPHDSTVAVSENEGSGESALPAVAPPDVPTTEADGRLEGAETVEETAAVIQPGSSPRDALLEPSRDETATVPDETVEDEVQTEVDVVDIAESTDTLDAALPDQDASLSNEQVGQAVEEVRPIEKTGVSDPDPLENQDQTQPATPNHDLVRDQIQAQSPMSVVQDDYDSVLEPPNMPSPVKDDAGEMQVDEPGQVDQLVPEPMVDVAENQDREVEVVQHELVGLDQPGLDADRMLDDDNIRTDQGDQPPEQDQVVVGQVDSASVLPEPITESVQPAVSESVTTAESDQAPSPHAPISPTGSNRSISPAAPPRSPVTSVVANQDHDIVADLPSVPSPNSQLVEQVDPIETGSIVAEVRQLENERRELGDGSVDTPSKGDDHAHVHIHDNLWDAPEPISTDQTQESGNIDSPTQPNVESVEVETNSEPVMVDPIDPVAIIVDPVEGIPVESDHDDKMIGIDSGEKVATTTEIDSPDGLSVVQIRIIPSTPECQSIEMEDSVEPVEKPVEPVEKPVESSEQPVESGEQPVEAAVEKIESSITDPNPTDIEIQDESPKIELDTQSVDQIKLDQPISTGIESDSKLDSGMDGSPINSIQEDPGLIKDSSHEVDPEDSNQEADPTRDSKPVEETVPVDAGHQST